MAIIVGTNNPETLDGTADADLILGMGGDDVLNGLGGNDTLDGGADNDMLFGNDGDDTAFLDVVAGGSDRIELGDGFDRVLTSGTNGQIRLTFTSAEVGNGAPTDSNTMPPNQDGGLAVRLQTEDGADALTGPVSRVDDEGIVFIAGGTSTFDVRDLVSGAQRGNFFEVVVLGTISADILTAEQAARPYYFNGGMGDDTITGGTANDFLVGGAGNDALSGGGGNNSFIGGGGNDTITGGAGTDTVIANVATDGADNVNLGGGTDIVNITAGAGTQVRLTFTSAEVGNGNANDSNTMPPNQDGGLALRLQAEDGADGLTGPISRYDDEGIVFVASAGATFDVRDLVSGAQRGNFFEVVVLGTIGADNLTAVQANRPYYFNAGMGNDTITGGTANDFLVGGAGNDTMTGGAGIDTSLGGGGDDSYFVDNVDIVIEAAGGGFDIVYASTDYLLSAGASVEVLGTVDNFATTAIDLTGNALDNFVTGNAGANTLDGGGGTDVLWGRAGDDMYFVEAGDDVVEYAGDGYDVVYARNSYTLSPNMVVEVLGTVDNFATTAIDLKGNEFANYVTGNAGVNRIDGGAGSDYLEGRGGGDVFAFTTALGATNVDEIADYLVGTDRIGLDAAIFAGIGTAGNFNPNAFRAGSTAQDADDRIIYNQASGQLFYDADGNGAGAQVLFGLVAGLPVLTANDFSVI